MEKHIHGFYVGPRHHGACGGYMHDGSWTIAVGNPYSLYGWICNDKRPNDPSSTIDRKTIQVNHECTNMLWVYVKLNILIKRIISKIASEEV